MKTYEILPHVADLQIRVFGRSKKGLLQNALGAMMEIQRPEIEPGKTVKRNIVVNALDLPSLVVDFLSEILYLGQVHREVYSGMSFQRFSDISIKGQILGQKVKRFGEDIKAVTFHNLKVRRKKDKTWIAEILFDI